MAGTLHTSPTTLAGYTFTASGTCYEVNSDGTIAGPFGPNVPAITDEGYVARRELTNLLLHSQAFDNAAWSKPNVTVTANATTAPDGTTTADRVTPTNGTVSARVEQAITAAAAIHTVDVWLKADTATSAVLGIRDNTAAANLASTAAILQGPGTASGTTLHTITGLSTTETRIRLILNAAATAGNSIALLIYPETSGTNTGKSVYAWQAQMFAATVPDPPLIVTTTAAATRGESFLMHDIFADSSALADQDMLIWAKGTPRQLASVNQRLLLLNEGLANDNNRIDLMIEATTAKAWALISAGGATALSQKSAGALTVDTEATIFARRNGGNWRAGTYINGTLTWLGADTAGAFPTSLVRAWPGAYRIVGFPFRGVIDSAFIKPGIFDTDQKVIDAITGAP